MTEQSSSGDTVILGFMEFLLNDYSWLICFAIMSLINWIYANSTIIHQALSVLPDELHFFLFSSEYYGIPHELSFLIYAGAGGGILTMKLGQLMSKRFIIRMRSQITD